MKKIGFLFVTIIMAMLFVVSASALEETGQLGDNIYWEYDNTTETLVISGTGDMWNYTSFMNAPFSNRGIEKIIINEGVTSIGNYALCGCRWVTSITIPNSVTNIGDYAIWECNDLQSITIPNSVTTIGDSAFNHCESLVSITVPDSVTSIGEYAFSYCTSLEKLELPNSITSIERGLVQHCTKLKYFDIPDSVTHIGAAVLYDTALYNDLDNWTNGLLTMDECIFESLTNNACISADIRIITDGAFSHDLPVVSAFEVDENNKYYSSDEYGVLYNKDKTVLVNYPLASKNKTYIVPDTVETVKELNSFYLETLVIPESVKKLPKIGPIGYSLTDLYIYNDSIEINPDGMMCFIDIDRNAWFSIRDEFAKVCEEYILHFVNGTITDEIEERVNEQIRKFDDIYINEIVANSTIYANEGSTAQAYANKYGINFKLLGEVVTESKDPATGVEVSYAPNTFSGDVEFIVEEGSENANINFSGLSGLFAKFESYDISFKVDGETVQPNGKVTVKLPIPDGFNSNFICVYHVDDNGNKTLLNSKVENGFVVFETNHFSEYVIVDESSIVEEPAEPEEPTVPEEPVEPDTPDEPTTPDTPDEPEVPDTPEEPEDTDASDPCSCNCHAGGIKAFFFKLINFFAKLFNPAKRVCACGAKH